MKKQFLHFQPIVTYVPTFDVTTEGRSEVAFVVDPDTRKFVKVGTPIEVENWLRTRILEGAGVWSDKNPGIALPCLTDAHNHVSLYSVLDVIGAGYVFGIDSFEKMAAAIREAVSQGECSIPKIILGHSTVTLPNIWRRDLDTISSRPLCLVDMSFHGMRVNTPMIKLLKEAAIQGMSGYLNEETGQCTEDWALLGIKITEDHFDVEEISAAMLKKLEQWEKQGILAIHDMDQLSWKELVSLMIARKKWGNIKRTSFPVKKIFLPPELLRELLQKQHELAKEGLFDPSCDWRMIGLKLVADGSLGSHTALLRKSYTDIDSCGISFHTLQQIDSALALAAKCGIMDVAMHAIGDQGILNALMTAKKWHEIGTMKGIGRKDVGPLFRIEHFELSKSGTILDAMHEKGIWVNSEPNFLADYCYEDRLGDRVNSICPHRDILNRGIDLHFGSDGMPTSALLGIWMATHHPRPDQQIDFSQALHASSYAPALYELNERGVIKEGSPADFILLDLATHAKLMPAQTDPNLFCDFGNDNNLMEQKARALENGIQTIYKEGRLVYQKG